MEGARRCALRAAQLVDMRLFVLVGCSGRHAHQQGDHVQGARQRAASTVPPSSAAAAVVVVVVVVVVEQVLERMGWQTATAENGREALAKAALFQPQLVIMDRHMPVSAGSTHSHRRASCVQVMCGDESTAELRRRGFTGGSSIDKDARHVTQA